MLNMGQKIQSRGRLKKLQHHIQNFLQLKQKTFFYPFFAQNVFFYQVFRLFNNFLNDPVLNVQLEPKTIRHF